MQSIYYCLFALSVGVVIAERIIPITDDPPIEEVHTSYGQGDHERVTYIRAVIRPGHINNSSRLDFPRSGYLNEYFTEGAAPGDERGHLVASQFSGSAEWYNLSPQNPRVNRNVGYQSLTTDWYGTECEVRNFLDRGGNRYVRWEVNMSYVGNSNRPNTYHLRVAFFEGGNEVYGIDTTLHNPLLSQDSTFWICRVCRSNRQDNNALRKNGDGCTRG